MLDIPSIQHSDMLWTMAMHISNGGYINYCLYVVWDFISTYVCTKEGVVCPYNPTDNISWMSVDFVCMTHTEIIISSNGRELRFEFLYNSEKRASKAIEVICVYVCVFNRYVYNVHAAHTMWKCRIACVLCSFLRSDNTRVPERLNFEFIGWWWGSDGGIASLNYRGYLRKYQLWESNIIIRLILFTMQDTHETRLGFHPLSWSFLFLSLSLYVLCLDHQFDNKWLDLANSDQSSLSYMTCCHVHFRPSDAYKLTTAAASSSSWFMFLVSCDLILKFDACVVLQWTTLESYVSGED